MGGRAKRQRGDPVGSVARQGDSCAGGGECARQGGGRGQRGGAGAGGSDECEGDSGTGAR